MIHIRTSILFSLAIILHSSCESDEPTKFRNIYNCHQEMNWDLEKMRQVLIGKWQWMEDGCVFTGTFDHRNDEISFEFSDSLVTIRDHDVIFQTSVWDIELGPNEIFVVTMDPASELFRGHIYLCENEMKSTDDLVSDGCEHYFERRE